MFSPNKRDREKVKGRPGSDDTEEVYMGRGAELMARMCGSMD